MLIGHSGVRIVLWSLLSARRKGSCCEGRGLATIVVSWLLEFREEEVVGGVHGTLLTLLLSVAMTKASTTPIVTTNAGADMPAVPARRSSDSGTSGLFATMGNSCVRLFGSTLFSMGCGGC